jgi:hypothetical protein
VLEEQQGGRGTRSSDGGAANTDRASEASGSVRQTREERGGGRIGSSSSLS